MPDLTFWEIVLMGLWLICIQIGTQAFFDCIRKWFEKRKDNTVCDLYINDEFSGKYTHKKCREIYENTDFKGHKGSGYARKTKTFHIHVDN